MRWDSLFDDLEAQAEAYERDARSAEIETRTRGETARLAVNDRLRAAVGTVLQVRVAGGLLVDGPLVRVGPDWLLLAEGGGREVVVAAAHLRSVRGLGRSSASPGSTGTVESRLGLRSVLRGIARDRSTVRVYLADGGAAGQPTGPVLDATLDRVGSDYVELAAVPPGELRRRTEVRAVELVPTAAVAAIRRTV